MFIPQMESEGLIYTKLMTEIKQINADWLKLRGSKQYKTGLVIVEFIDDLSHFKFAKLKKHISRWIKGLKSRKIKTIDTRRTQEIKTNYFSSEKIAVYSAVFGDYDTIPEPYFKPDNCDFFIFTDQQISTHSIWRKKEIADIVNGMNNMEKNRYIKMHPHIFFPDYKYSIYVDGNVCVMTDLTEYVNILNEIGLGIHLHNTRSCIYDELTSVVATNRMTQKEAKKFKDYAMSLHFPPKYGLLQCSVIVREHNNPICISIMEDWWQLYMKYGKRDQLYLPLALFLHHISVSNVTILGNDLYCNPSFRIYNHK